MVYLPLRKANQLRQCKRKKRSAMTRRVCVVSGSLSFVIACSLPLKGYSSLVAVLKVLAEKMGDAELRLSQKSSIFECKKHTFSPSIPCGIYSFSG